MARNQRSYDNEYKAQAVKLAQEIGGHKAATELGFLEEASAFFAASRRNLAKNRD